MAIQAERLLSSDLSFIFKGGRVGALTEGRYHGIRLFAGIALVIACFGAFASTASAKKCLKAPEVAVILDDSGSMGRNDRLGIRAQALRLFIEKPSSQSMTLGAVEFGSRGARLFRPGVVSKNRNRMLASLGRLENDGADDGGGSTSYNAAFRASRRLQPRPDARIFLTDGGSTDSKVRVGLAKGAPTYVIGLNIGKPQTSKDARKLRRIARIGGGRYFPLKMSRRDSPGTQLNRLQPVINRIASKLGCSKITRTINVTAKRKGQTFGPYTVKFGRQQTIQALATWTTPGTTVRFVNCRAVTRGGRVVADLEGRGKRSKLRIRIYTNKANNLLVVKRPHRGWKLVFKVRVVKLKRKTPIVVQVERGGGGNAFRPGSGGGGTPPNPQPVTRVITVYNQVTNGMSMREDSTPARLLTKPWRFCTSRGCNINGTERSTGQTYDAAVCQTSGDRTTNGNDGSGVDDANPALFESSRYYGVRLSNGVFGYISEVWIAAEHRGGLGLPNC